ncbi:hypothetical protein HDU89_003127 [Geranomyces variabilis]|nr:hypothetical protein HDU90_001528 [Geranomyces variabilis]KAJ3150349.1 hypothetical protein HDU89_003127 [Geranomyces variabilis]KAJ3171402.1 hypothetical protein HDU88_007481 [Geranomyces variabilis]
MEQPHFATGQQNPLYQTPHRLHENPLYEPMVDEPGVARHGGLEAQAGVLD